MASKVPPSSPGAPAASPAPVGPQGYTWVYVAPEVQRAEEFAQRMLDTLTGASLAMMISIGHRTGLFDAMAKAGRGLSRRASRYSAAIHGHAGRIHLSRA